MKPVVANRATRPGFLTLFLVTLTLALAAGAGAYDSARAFEQAGDLLDGGAFLESLSMYREIADLGDGARDRARALFTMGAVYSMYLDRQDAAIGFYDTVILDFPQTDSAAEALFNKGMVLFETGRYADSAAAFHGYLRKYPDGRRAGSAAVWLDAARDSASMDVKPRDVRPERPAPGPDIVIRILLADGVERLPVKAEKTLRCTDPATGRVVFEGTEAVFSSRDGTLLVNGEAVSAGKCVVRGVDGMIALGNKLYRGDVLLTAEDAGVRAVNRVPLEQYLYGVVPGEMPASWPREALKAQAVSARSYVAYLWHRRQDRPWDVCATTSSQVYGGHGVEHPASNAAVDATRGQVLSHGDELVLAYFHSNSGGHTESAEKVWVTQMPYLKGVPDPYSATAPGNHWSYVLTNAELSRLLTDTGLCPSELSDLKPVSPTDSGRMEAVNLTCGGRSLTLRSNNFRLKVGPRKVRSTRFTVTRMDRGYLLEGTGFGHGVGMSQWGAREMAVEGHEYRDILRFYYRGSRVDSLMRQASLDVRSP
ncbi:MAG: SpoIID/LytB domain-containing protein [Desulfatibacillaceae bacterium]